MTGLEPPDDLGCSQAPARLPPDASPPAREDARALSAHVLPFAAWLLVMALPVANAGAWNYVLRSVITLFLFLLLRPWNWYERIRVGQLVWPVLVGAVVALVWIGPETSWVDARLPSLKHAYLKLGVGFWPFGAQPVASVLASPYAPHVCGWPLALVRLFGSAFVIAPVEEFFWRGFLYRWFQRPAFLSVELGHFRASAFFVVVLLFAVEHDRWLVGIIAGLVYGWLAIRTRDIWSAVAAHVTTNLLLGLYVLATGAYQFW